MRIEHVAYVLLLTLGGCEKTDPLFCKMNPGATGCTMMTDDGGVDPDAEDFDAPPDAQACFGGGPFAVCLAEAPTAMITMPSSFNTTMGIATSPACIATPMDWTTGSGQPDACFVVGDTITISGRLDVTGDRPLVLLAATSITVNGDIDAASHRGGKTGPGAPSDLCPSFMTAPVGNSNGGGGGAGGSFITQGGNGGVGNNGASANGVITAAAGSPLVLRAGCDGQNGGSGNANGAGGTGGASGGAIYLLAGSITLMPGISINASGAGGARTLVKDAGGAGGGSGGMIVLHASMITGAGAFLIANGGGGSSGADDSGNGNATDGEDPVATDPTNAANGGNAPSGAGDGGNGWVQGDLTGGLGGVGVSSRGGGGGGGGGGYIRTNVASGALESPTASIIP